MQIPARLFPLPLQSPGPGMPAATGITTSSSTPKEQPEWRWAALLIPPFRCQECGTHFMIARIHVINFVCVLAQLSVVFLLIVTCL